MFAFLLAIALIDAIVVFLVFSVISISIAYIRRKISPKTKKDIKEIIEEDF